LGSAVDAATLASFANGVLNGIGFYADIEAFDDFSGIADLDNYRRAACINAVLDISQAKTIPYVFGR